MARLSIIIIQKLSNQMALDSYVSAFYRSKVAKKFSTEVYLFFAYSIDALMLSSVVSYGAT
jgi:hypothetical protein